MTSLTVTGLSVRLGEQQVLSGVDLHVPAGTIASVLGPSGCGKTTLLRAVCGFVPVAAGEVRIGEDVVSAPGRAVAPERRGVGLVPQEGALFAHLDVAGNVAFGLARGISRAERDRRTAEVLELVGLAGYERRRPAQLSGGQQQRVALARALAPRPRLVLLDEPFSALDAGLRSAVRAEVKAALRADGATAVVVTHDQDEALSMADSVAVLEAGRVLMHDGPQQVYEAPTAPAVARIVGQCLELPGTVRGDRVETALGALAYEGAAADGQAGIALLRPEQVVLHRPGSNGSIGSNGSDSGDGADGVSGGAQDGGIVGEVVETSYHGHDALVLVRVGDLVVWARTTGLLPELGPVGVGVAGRVRFFPQV